MATTTSTDSGAVTRAGPRKREAITTLADKLSRATSAVITDYRGLSVKELQDLRGQLRKEGVEYVVVKNTLARRAANDAGLAEFTSVLTGPVGLAFGYDDLAAPARLLNNYFKANRRLPIMAGLVEGRVLSADQVKTLADLPSREALLAQLAGTLLSPLTQLAGSLNSVMSNFAATLDAYGKKLEAAG